MTWAAFKSLATGQRPVWLYRLTIGATTEYYTPRATAFTYDSQSYSPLAISRGRIPNTGDERKAQFDLTVPSSAAFCQSLISGVGLQRARVEVLSGDAGDPDQEFITRFYGVVTGFKTFFDASSWGRMRLVCENDFTRGRARLMPRVMDRICPYALYGSQCGLNIADFNVAGTVTARSGNTLTISAAALQADEWYRSGILTYNGHRQMISGHTGDQITLLADVPGLFAEIDTLGTASVEIAPGCNKQPSPQGGTSDCETKFSNYDNFGGIPNMRDNDFDGRTLG